MDTFKRYKKFGFSEGYVNHAGLRESIDRAYGIRNMPDRAFVSLDSVCDNLGFMAKGYWLDEQPEKALESGRDLLSKGKEFFLGQWQTIQSLEDGKKPDPARWRAMFSWQSKFRDIFAWGSALGAWSDLAELSAYLTHQIAPDPSEAQRTFYVAMGKHFQAQPDATVRPDLEKLIQGRDKLSRLQAQTALAILNADSAGAQKAFDELGKHWKSRDFKLDWCFFTEGVFFYHWGRHKGIQLSVRSDLEDYLLLCK